MKFGTKYCEDASQKTKFKDALTKTLKDGGMADCLKTGQCDMPDSDYSCTWDGSTVLSVAFKLNQLFDLDDPSVVTSDGAAISAAGTITIDFRY